MWTPRPYLPQNCTDKPNEPNGAGGLDGWAPAEFKLMPLTVRVDRETVENCILVAQKHPDVYYHAPIVLLRKGEGRTPKQHRGITILITSYRQTSGIWWNRIKKPLLEWVHGGACGGLPGTEPTLAAWDAQHDMEKALLRGIDWAQVNTD